MTGQRNAERAEFPTFKTPQTWYATALGVDCYESTDRTMIAAYPAADIEEKPQKSRNSLLNSANFAYLAFVFSKDFLDFEGFSSIYPPDMQRSWSGRLIRNNLLPERLRTKF